MQEFNSSQDINYQNASQVNGKEWERAILQPIPQTKISKNFSIMRRISRSPTLIES